MEPLNGSQKHGLQRKARKQLTCLDEELATTDLTRAERVDIWLTGACWVIKRGIPGLLVLGALSLGVGRLGAHLGLW